MQRQAARLAAPAPRHRAPRRPMITASLRQRGGQSGTATVRSHCTSDGVTAGRRHVQNGCLMVLEDRWCNPRRPGDRLDAVNLAGRAYASAASAASCPAAAGGRVRRRAGRRVQDATGAAPRHRGKPDSALSRAQARRCLPSSLCHRLKDQAGTSASEPFFVPTDPAAGPMIERRLKHGTSTRSRLRVQATFRDSRLDKISLTMSTGSNVRTDVSVTTVNLLVYRDQFVAEVVGHVADLNSGVNAPHAGTFEQTGFILVSLNGS